MAKLKELKVVRYRSNRVPNWNPDGAVSWSKYQRVRNDLVRTCRRHGPTGPVGERSPDNAHFPPGSQLSYMGEWEAGDDDPHYYIIPDKYNDELYLYAELSGEDPFHIAWVEDVVETLRRHPGWGSGIQSLPNAYVLLFGDRMLVTGPGFGWWPNAMKVVEVASRLLREREG